MPTASPNHHFLDLFTGSQLRLYRYIVILVANHAEAEDILQNTNLVLLQKCDQFQPGTNFGAWSQQIAYLEVLKYRATKKRTAWRLSDEALATIASDAGQQAAFLEDRNRALPHCMEKLPATDLALVTDHYFRGLSWETIADELGRTSSSVRHSICRIRRRLKECIDAVLSREERP